METFTQTDILLKIIDFELRELLRKDLEVFRMLNENNQAEIKKAA